MGQSSMKSTCRKCYPLSDDDVLRAAAKAKELTELVKDARALASALRNVPLGAKVLQSIVQNGSLF